MAFKNFVKNQKHQFEDNPPSQERFIVGDDNWKLAETQLPINHEKVNPRSGDPQALCGRYGSPAGDDTVSAQVIPSRSNGKEK